jgi:tryptophan 2,3-dioxygenase
VTTPQRRGAASPAQQTPTQHRANGRAASRSAVAGPALADQTAAERIAVAEAPAEPDGRLSYGTYLRLTDLLAQQVPQADPPAPDELLFITVHQVYELWFKQLLCDLEAARDAMCVGEAWRAKHLLHRVHAVERLMVVQVDILETMAPQDFNVFRPVLGPASGFQSVQYRELEYLSGVRDQRFLARHLSLTDAERERLLYRLGQPTVWDGYLTLLRDRGMTTGSDAEIMASLRDIAADRARYDDLWQLAEDLLTHDELASVWRSRHVSLVERQIGLKPGTGGSPGAPYLRARVPLRYYPLLWQLREYL